MTISRIIVGVLGVLVGGFGISILYWEIVHQYWDSTAIPAALVTVGLLAVWFALRGRPALERIVHSLICGVGAAIVGLAVGLIGAVYFYPESNLAPLIVPVLLTAPAGFVLGCIGGFIWHMATRKSLFKL
jgi:hypothetical protein